mmetsp:Transcript_114491/g.199158  ORF Transcript_114491/g.199158 Transcript_114491/m.199158 type:complete len:91 (+) Transcript_114491:457-729(+)
MGAAGLTCADCTQQPHLGPNWPPCAFSLCRMGCTASLGRQGCTYVRTPASGPHGPKRGNKRGTDGHRAHFGVEGALPPGGFITPVALCML